MIDRTDEQVAADVERAASCGYAVDCADCSCDCEHAANTIAAHIDAAQALDALAADTSIDDVEQAASYVADAAEHRRAAAELQERNK